MGPLASFVAFDLETAGLDYTKNEIVEIAGVKFTLEIDGKKIIAKNLGTFESFIKPNMHMPEETSRINGITDSMLEDAPSAVEILPEFTRFCGQSTILIAHNAIFDARFLKRALVEGQMVIPQNPIMDSLLMSRRILPEAKVHKLGVLAKRFRRELTIELDDEALHRALYDCEVLRDVFVSLVRKQFLPEDLEMGTFIPAVEKAIGSPMFLKTI